MYGFWFAVMVAFLVTAGVLVQLGWQLPEREAVKRALQRSRPRPERGATSSAMAEPQ
jgi:hypothetical protein